MPEKIKINFGMHRGKYLDDVPANYLDWLSKQDWITDYPAINQYINDNRKGIDKQIADGLGDV